MSNSNSKNIGEKGKASEKGKSSEKSLNGRESIKIEFLWV